MLLYEQMKRNGTWIFRYRSYLPLVFLAILVSANFQLNISDESRLDRIWETVCILLSLSGVLLRIFTVAYLPDGNSGRNTRRQKASVLNTTGLYSIVRNPLYIGNFLIGLGIVMYAQYWWIFIIYSLVFYQYYERIILVEESFLLDKFEFEYQTYTSRVPVMIPKLNGWIPASRPFSIRKVVKREHAGIVVMISAFTLVQFSEESFSMGHPELETGWLIALSVSLVSLLVTRLILSNTKLLQR